MAYWSVLFDKVNPFQGTIQATVHSTFTPPKGCDLHGAGNRVHDALGHLSPLALTT
jgi:hypothetical protein